MFTTLSFVLIFAIAWWSDRKNDEDRKVRGIFDDDEVRQAIVHARQDLKLVALTLAGVMVMLGVIADRIR
jgi:hypothetical protein